MRDTIDMAREACPYTRVELRGAFYDGFVQAAALVRADEREACAKVCEDHAPTTTPTWVSYAAAIRARGNT
jgi:hypothetical protein